jgi:hypothetical protein
MPANTRRCIESHTYSIIDRAMSAEENQNVPAGIILIVAFKETHIGCHHGRTRYGNWGAPSSRRYRNRNGTSFHAAIALQHSFEICRNWEGAINRFRCGFCECDPARIVGYTPNGAINAIRRLYQSVDLEVPEPFTRPIHEHILVQPRHRRN